MKRILIALLLVLPTATAAQASTIIDFEAVASGTVLTNQYAGLGVTFSAFENAGLVDSIVIAGSAIGIPDSPPNNSGNFWGNTDTIAFGNRWDVLRVSFTNPAANVNWYTGTLGGLSITFNAYDSGGNLLQSVVSGTQSQGGPFVFTSFAVSGIAYFEGLQPADDWGWGMDNLSFDPGTAANVPEPGSLSLLALGLAGWGARRRRQRKAQQTA
jgi:hypothetical protein